MRKFSEWARNHKGTVAAIGTGIAGLAGTLTWGLLPEEEQPVKEEWIPPKKKNWYMESDD